MGFAARVSLMLLVCTLFGCGKRLEGVYEARPVLPAMGLPQGMPGMADLQKQLDNTYKHAAQLMTTTLEFRGSKVWLGQAEGSFEYDYEVTGSELILRANISGQPVRVAMRLMDDGSIEYLGLRFKKVR